jgi:amino acid adenylation domain-containing protein
MSIQDRISALNPQQRALFEQVRAERLAAARQQQPQQQAIPRVSGPDAAGDWPLSFDQERLWLVCLLNPDSSTAFNLLSATRLEGDLDVAALRSAFDEILRRQAAWRSTFPIVDGAPVQRVAPHLTLPLPVIDLSALPQAVREPAALKLVQGATQQPFDLGRGPLVSAKLIRLAAREHICLLSVHHIISDSITFQLYWNELALLYAVHATGRPQPLPELPVQYPDFAVWQRGWMQGETLAASLGWWQEQLRGFPHVLEVPADRPRRATGSMRGGQILQRLDRGLTEGLRDLARRERATRFMVMTALTAVLLHRLSGQERLLLGTLNANRNRTELQPLFGYFLTQLTLPIGLEGDLPFAEVLARVRTAALGAFAHQDLPFGKLVDAVQPERELGRNPLVQTLIQLLEVPQNPPRTPGHLHLEPVDVYDGHARYDLMFLFFEDASSIYGPLEYNADLFDATTATRMADTFQALAAAVAIDPGLRLSALPTFSPAVRHQVLFEWNDTAVAGPPAVTELFAAQAARTPDAVAVEVMTGEGAPLTYAELDTRAGRLARRLRRLGVGPESRVGLAVERSPEMLIGLLAILKAGGAYVPLDPAWPQDRLAFMLDDSGAALLLTQERLTGKLPSGPQVLLLDSEEPEEYGVLPELVIHPETAAYVIYTSGSTGRPKGVVVPHRSIAAYVRTAMDQYAIGSTDRVLQFGSISFDTSAEEIWPALAAGATLVLRSAEMTLSTECFLRELERTGITVLDLQTAFWNEVVAGLEAGGELPPSVRLLIIGGEAALPDRVATWRRTVGPRVRLVNTYGPTEATIVATHCDLTQPEGNPEVPIGRPIPGARVYVVDPRGEPVPPLATGELLIGGEGVARGYLGRPDLTAERFLPDPWSGAPGARLYRSGDLARFRPGGELLFAGRADRQLKVRGYRIEPGEIEAALRQHAVLHDAVVDVRGTGDDKRLIAWVVPREGMEAPAGPDLRLFLRERLPEPLVPALFVPLVALPLTPSGKLDRRALPDPGEVRPDLPGYVEPGTTLERTIAAVFRDLLRVDRVGLHDNFFDDLGGHSLLVVRAHQMLRDELQHDLAVVDLFRFPTVALLARHLGGDNEPTFQRVQSLAEQQRAAQVRQRQAMEKLRPGRR